MSLAPLLGCGKSDDRDDNKVPEKLKLEEMRDSTRLDSADTDDAQPLNGDSASDE